MYIEGMPVYVDPSHGEWLARMVNTADTLAERGLGCQMMNLTIDSASRRPSSEQQASSPSAKTRSTLNTNGNSTDGHVGDREWHDTGVQDAPVFGDFYATDGFQFAVSGKVIYLGKK